MNSTILERLAEVGMTKAMLLVEEEAKKLAPKDTGALRRSIKSKVYIDGDTVVGEVGTVCEYAPYVEYGTGLYAEAGNGRKEAWVYQDDNGKWHSTRGMKAQPFLRPALENNLDDVYKMIKEGITNDKLS